MMIRNHTLFAFLLCFVLSFAGISSAIAAIKVTTTEDMPVTETGIRTKVQCSWKGGRVGAPGSPLVDVYYGEPVEQMDNSSPLVKEFDSIADGEVAGYICCGADPESADGKGYTVYESNGECSLRKAVKSVMLRTAVKSKAGTQPTDYQFDYDLGASYAICPDDPRRNFSSRSSITDEKAEELVNAGQVKDIPTALAVGGAPLSDKNLFPYRANVVPIVDCAAGVGIRHEVHLEIGSEYLLEDDLDVAESLRIIGWGAPNTTVSSTDFALGNDGLIYVEDGLFYEKDQSITIAHDMENYQESKVLSYNKETGALSFDFPTKTVVAGQDIAPPTQTVGSSSYSSWKVNLNKAEISAQMKSRLFEVHGSLLALENIHLTNGDAKGEDGGLVLLNTKKKTSNGVVLGSMLEANNVELSNGSARNGGLIYISNISSANMEGVALLDGSATDNGGAIYAAAGAKRIAISRFNIEDNTAGLSGGAIYTRTETLALKEGSVIDNDADIGVGGVEVISAGNITLENLTFSQNESKDGVGALKIDGVEESDRLKNLTIMENIGVNDVGGIKVEGGSELTLANSIIVANTEDGNDGNCHLLGVGTGAIGDLIGHHNLVPFSEPSCLPSGADGDYDVDWDLGSGDITKQFSYDSFELGDVKTRGYMPVPLLAVDNLAVDNLAIDHGANAGAVVTCLVGDQLAEGRENTDCDIGAIEYQVAAGMKDTFYYGYAASQNGVDCAPTLLNDGAMILDVACNDFMDDKKMLEVGLNSPCEDCKFIAIAWVGTADSQHGTITADNSDPDREKLRYTAPAGFHGEDVFRYTYYVEGDKSLNEKPVSGEVRVVVQPQVVSCNSGGSGEPSGCIKSGIEEYVGTMSLWMYFVTFFMFLIRARHRVFMVMGPVIALLAINVTQAAEIVVTTESVVIDNTDGLCSLPEAVASSRDGGVNMDPAACADGSLGKDIIVFDKILLDGKYDACHDLNDSERGEQGTVDYGTVTVDLSLEDAATSEDGYPCSNVSSSNTPQRNLNPIILKNYNPLVIQGELGKTQIKSSGIRIFESHSALTLSELELSGGNARDREGGLIRVVRGGLTLARAKLVDGTASSGGAVFVGAEASSLSIRDSHFEGNVSDGNEAGEGGGAVFVSSGVQRFDLIIERSSFVGNSSAAGGSALDLNGHLRIISGDNQSKYGSITSSTFTGNQSETGGAIDIGGLANANSFIINNVSVLDNTTVAGSSAGIVFIDGFNLYNSFISGNTNTHAISPLELNCSDKPLFRSEYNLVGQSDFAGGCQVVDLDAPETETNAVLSNPSWDTQVGKLDEDSNTDYGYVRYFKPVDTGTSGLVGKGSLVVGEGAALYACGLLDQLANKRKAAPRCDIGAVQLVHATAIDDVKAKNNAYYGRSIFQNILRNDIVDKRIDQFIKQGFGLKLASDKGGPYYDTEIEISVYDDKTEEDVPYMADIKMACDALSDIEHAPVAEGGFGIPYPGICLRDFSADIINDNQIILFDRLNPNWETSFGDLSIGSWVKIDIDYLGSPISYTVQVTGMGYSEHLTEKQKDELSLSGLKEEYQFLMVYPDFPQQMPGGGSNYKNN